MASVINTNNASLVAQRNLSNSQSDLTTSVQRLSSGLRINSAKDDAAGLGISEKLQSQITSANIGARNASDAISMVQTAEGGLQEVSSMLQRMRELATQGNNDSLSTTQMGYIGAEIDSLRSEINKVAARTTFNGKTLLNGANATAGTVMFQTGTAATDTVDISTKLIDVQVTSTGDSVTGTNTGMAALGTQIDLTVGSSVAGVLTATPQTSTKYGTLATAIDTAITSVATARSDLGAMQNRLEANIGNLQSQAENLTASKSRITDADYAAETANLTKNQIMQQAATAMLSQANQMPNVVLSLLK
ncbi:MAG: flagellin [Aquabacterium sp.]|nr:flagellin [Aquabacterium sp.]